MPRVTKQDWRESKRKLRRSERAALIALGALIMVAAVIPGLFLATAPKASALGNVGPAPSDFQGRRMTFVVDNTPFVGAVATSVMTYFQNKNGNAVTISSAGLTNSPNYDTFYSAVPGNPIVTRYDLFDVQTGALMDTCSAAKNTPTCVLNFNFPAATSVDIRTGFFGAQLRATLTPPAGEVFQNGFWVTLSAGNVVGFDSTSPATTFAMQENIVAARYTDWSLKFGADCSVLPPAGKSVPFIWYDPDNGSATVQPQKSSFQILDVTGAPTVVNLYSPGGNDFTTGVSPAVLNVATDTVAPGNNSKTNGHVFFTAMPGHIYQVQWDHVFSNNTLQFQLPFDSIYFLTRGCAINPYTITPTLTTALTHLEPGTAGTINAIATANTGPTAPYTMSVASSGPTPPLVSGVSALNVYNPAPPTWAELGFPGASSRTRSFTVNVSATVPDGTWICFTNTINPAKWTQATGFTALSSARLCLEVYRTRYPAVQGFNGDIHAGAGLCVPQTNTLAAPGWLGYVKGNPLGNSFGQYVVSASQPNGITDFGSAGSVGGTTLNLGLTGAYAQACRPDLLAEANTYRLTGLGFATIGLPVPPAGPKSIDVTGMSGIYYFDGGGDLNITGTVKKSVTIVKTNASGVVRMGTVARSAALYPAHSSSGVEGVPSLGVIAAGDIQIPAAVTNVDAYLFANGSIDTCPEGTSAVIATKKLCASPILTIHGFLMARNIFFRRLGPFGTQGAITAEQVYLGPQIYLNPPKLFDFTIDDNFADGQGEKQPLF